jgi:hypothetical protein
VGWDDQSTPKAALTLAHLMFTLPVAFLPPDELLYAEDEPGRQFIEAMSGAVRANMRLYQAVSAKWGEEAAHTLHLGVPDRREAERSLTAMGDPFFAEVEKMTEKVNGEEAVVRHPRNPDHPVRAKRIGGRWKLNLADAGGGIERHGAGTPGYKEPDVTLEVARMEAKLAEALARKVEAAEIKDAKALAELRAEGRKAMEIQLEGFRQDDPDRPPRR